MLITPIIYFILLFICVEGIEMLYNAFTIFYQYSLSQGEHNDLWVSYTFQEYLFVLTTTSYFTNNIMLQFNFLYGVIFGKYCIQIYSL